MTSKRTSSGNHVEIKLPAGGPVRVFQFHRNGRGCLSYLVGSRGVAVVIDASLDPQVYLKAAGKLGFRIAGALDTHIHSDHLSRSRRLSELAGGAVALPETARVTFPYQKLRDSDAIPIGDVLLTAMRTPGHTPESVCYRLDNRALFTGDTLLAGSVGRPDCDGNSRSAVVRAKALHRTIAHLTSLPPGMLVLPSHLGTSAPWTGSPVLTTLGEASSFEGCGLDEAAFVRLALEGLGELGDRSQRIVKLNEKGEFSEREARELEG